MARWHEPVYPQYQRVRNQRRPKHHWDVGDQTYVDAEGHRRQWTVSVRARIVWSRDGERMERGWTKRWTYVDEQGWFIYVELPDARIAGGGVWLLGTDVFLPEPDEDW